jgi:hypothetical protein
MGSGNSNGYRPDSSESTGSSYKLFCWSCPSGWNRCNIEQSAKIKKGRDPAFAGPAYLGGKNVENIDVRLIIILVILFTPIIDFVGIWIMFGKKEGKKIDNNNNGSSGCREKYISCIDGKKALKKRNTVL